MKHTLQLPAGVELPGEGPLQLAVDVHLPDRVSPRVMLVCLPGGAMMRRYYDLRVPDAPAEASFSFAAQMNLRGFGVIAIDHLGVGESSRPADGYALTAEVVAKANAHVTATVLDGLRKGTLVPGQAAVPNLEAVGVGHSMGAMLALVQQAAHRSFGALALLGFSTRGLPEYVPAAAKELAKDPEALRAKLPELARGMFVESYPVIKPSPGSNAIYAGASADPRGVAAIKPVMDRLLPVPSFHSMIPGNVAAEAARITVPVYLGLGENDMAGPTHDIPAAFKACRDVTLHILPGTGHSHFLFPARTALYDRLTAWLRSVVPGGA